MNWDGGLASWDAWHTRVTGHERHGYGERMLHQIVVLTGRVG